MVTRKDIAATFCRAYGFIQCIYGLSSAPQIWSAVNGSNSIPLYYFFLPSLFSFTMGIALIVFSAGLGAEMTGEVERALEKPVDSPGDVRLLGRASFGLMLLGFALSQFLWRAGASLSEKSWDWSALVPAFFSLQTALPILVAGLGFYLAFGAGISARLRRPR